MFHRILVALDNSDLSETVFGEALSLAQATQACLMLLHVLSDAEIGYPQPHTLDTHLEQWQTYQSTGMTRLQVRQAAASQAGVIAEYVQTPGAAPATICRLAQTWGADLIVIGQRELSGIQKFIRGSVSNYVMHYAPCSVLTVHS
ncbi:MAG: universal stress protein [Synechococcales cyanobacterium C42_A2020_086]|jgi:nucleotide-binding universal stress UspA family protein|nr:universal stress protein [Synechococcales cyanobacterium M58_A2018_015]MBF2073294.1 universal stress protein [Synechococcales cyanobacterium C42_A2020_086]